jgi:DNA processing protein
LTEKAVDVLSHIHSLLNYLAEPSTLEFRAQAAHLDEKKLDAAREKILENLGPSPVPVDELVRQCQLSAPTY